MPDQWNLERIAKRAKQARDNDEPYAHFKVTVTKALGTVLILVVMAIFVKNSQGVPAINNGASEGQFRVVATATPYGGGVLYAYTIDPTGYNRSYEFLRPAFGSCRMPIPVGERIYVVKRQGALTHEQIEVVDCRRVDPLSKNQRAGP